MAMESASEVAKWVCQLTSFFDGWEEKGPSSGTGFLVHIPNSSKFCIMTAAHNMLDPELKWAKKIRVNFLDGLEFTVTPDEWRVSKVYENNPTNSATDDASLLDYAMIMTDREKHLTVNPDFADPGGCGFDVLMRDSDLLDKQVAVFGYMNGSHELKMNLSELDSIKRHTLHYSKDTVGGVSGAPVIISKNGAHTAVGIHRATRLTPAVMLEMLSWIDDYQLRQVVEVASPKGPKSYLQATDGVQPNITARPGLAYLNFVLAVAPKARSTQHCHHVVLPGSAHSGQDAPLLFLALLDDETPPRLAFQAGRGGARGQIRIDIAQPLGKPWVVLSWPHADRRVLKVKPRKRITGCTFGCITHDDEVVTDRLGGTRLLMSPYKPTDNAVNNPDTGRENLPLLYKEVQHRDLREVMRLLDQGEDAGFSCTCGTTAVSKAAENGDLAIIDALIKHGGSIESKNCDGESPDMLARRNGHVRVTNRLQYLRCQLVEKLLRAAKEGSTQSIRNLLNRGVAPDARNVSPIITSKFAGSSALEIAAQYGHRDAVLLLLRDAKVTATDADARGVTALHQAAQTGHAVIIQHLLEFGADVNGGDKTKMTPLHRAAERGHVAAITGLCSNPTTNVNLNPRGPLDVTPLMLAAQNGHAAAVKVLVDMGADVTLVDRKGETAWDKADGRGRLEVCSILPFS